MFLKEWIKLTKRGFAPLKPPSLADRQKERIVSFLRPKYYPLSIFIKVKFASLICFRKTLTKILFGKKAIIRFHRFDRTTKILSIRNMRFANNASIPLLYLVEIFNETFQFCKKEFFVCHLISTSAHLRAVKNVNYF